MIEGIAAALPALNQLSEGMGKNRDKYPVFDTEETDPEKFWDSLNKGPYHMFGRIRQYHSKIDVGNLAVHQGFMTPNFIWYCGKEKFKDLPKRQQKIIAATLNTKDEKYLIISLRSLAGNLFRIR